jgi:hypothetical protein
MSADRSHESERTPPDAALLAEANEAIAQAIAAGVSRDAIMALLIAHDIWPRATPPAAPAPETHA